METNLICTTCGTDYYSASPELAKETTECDNGCGLSLVAKETRPIVEEGPDMKRHTHATDNR